MDNKQLAKRSSKLPNWLITIIVYIANNLLKPYGLEIIVDENDRLRIVKDDDNDIIRHK